MKLPIYNLFEKNFLNLKLSNLFKYKINNSFYYYFSKNTMIEEKQISRVIQFFLEQIFR